MIPVRKDGDFVVYSASIRTIFLGQVLSVTAASYDVLFIKKDGENNGE